MLDSLGWRGKRAFDSQFLWEYAFGTTQDGGYKYGRSLEDANNEVWRRILNNLPYLLKHKGTGRAMKAVMCLLWCTTIYVDNNGIWWTSRSIKRW